MTRTDSRADDLAYLKQMLKMDPDHYPARAHFCDACGSRRGLGSYELLHHILLSGQVCGTFRPRNFFAPPKEDEEEPLFESKPEPLTLICGCQIIDQWIDDAGSWAGEVALCTSCREARGKQAEEPKRRIHL